MDGDGGSEAREAAQEEEAGGDKDEDEDELLHKIDMWYKLLGTLCVCARVRASERHVLHAP